jgi:CRISPR-associated protein Csd1
VTILQSLARRYYRLVESGDAPVPGFAPAQISFTFVLDRDGKLITIHDERVDVKKRARSIVAPQAPGDRRGERIASGTFWDPTDYAIGVPRPELTGSQAASEKLTRKAIEKHAAFKARHAKLLEGSSDQGCSALLAFLAWWTPEMLANYSLGNEVPGSNITFSLDGERGFLFERPAALTLMTGESSERDTQIGMCLVTGENAPIARLHSPIKGIVSGSQCEEFANG